MPSRKGFIWPKDPLPGRPRRGFKGRLQDVWEGKGPDIYVGRLDTQHATPKTAIWSNWADRRRQTPMDEYLGTFTELGPVWGTKKTRRRYDFRTRRYVDIDKVVRNGMAGGLGAAGVWMDVKYCDDLRCNDPTPVEWTDGWGHRHTRYWAHDHDHEFGADWW